MVQLIQCDAIILDFDGTLADSMLFLEKIGVQVMMKYYAIKKEDATRKYRITTGLPYEHQIKHNFPNHENNKAAITEFEKLKIDRIFEQELFPDAQQTLLELSQLKLDIFVSSSTFQSTIIKYFEQRGLKEFFKEILGYRPGFEKGADHFKHIQSKYDHNSESMVFIGDSLKDYERSKGFAKFIGKTGLFSEQDFRNVGHDGPVIDNLQELPGLLSIRSS